MKIKRPKPRQFMPENAKKVFSGVLFDVYQWKEKLFDGSQVKFEKLRRIDTVNIVVVKDGKVILLRQEQPGIKPFIGVAGGRIDKGETPLEAAERELLEEMGLTSNDFALWFSYQPLTKIDWAVYTFIARDCQKIQEAKPDAGEKFEIIEVTFNDFLKTVADENFRDIEISLKVFQAMMDERKMDELKKMFRLKL